jgi:hypothetical protein
LLELDFQKTFRDGVLEFEFLAEGQGIVSIAFRYVDKLNHYLLEIGGYLNQYIQLKKVIDGKSAIINKNDKVGYEHNIWYRVIITTNENQIKVFMN